MAIETKQLHALSRIYKEQVAEDMQKGYVVTAADKKGNTKAWQGYKSGAKKKDGTPLYTAADHLKDEVEYTTEAKKAAKDYDGDGKIESGKEEYFGSKDKAIKKAMKKESFSNWRQDLKEIPDYEQIPASAKKRNEKISEKNVKNTVKINPEMKEETQVDEGVYEKQKTKEVMGALKKRDLKTSVKKKIAADIVKKKGDTSKSDDRYAYESKLWDQVAENLTELGELGGVKYKVVPLDESDIADILARLEKKRISKGGDPDESPLGKKTGRAMKAQQDKARKKAGL